MMTNINKNNTFILLNLLIILVSLTSAQFLTAISSDQSLNRTGEFNMQNLTLYYVFEPIPTKSNVKPFIIVYTKNNSSTTSEYIGYLFKNATIIVNIFNKDNTTYLTFTVKFEKGLLGDFNFINGGRNVSFREIRKNVSFSYSYTYLLDTKTMMLYTLDGKWAGPFPYLANVDLQKPTFKILFISPSIQSCLFSIGLNSTLRELLTAVNGSNELQVIKPHEKVTVEIGPGISITRNGPGILVKECNEFGLYMIILDPLIKTGDYRFGSLFFPRSNIVAAKMTYGGYDVLEVFNTSSPIIPLGDGIALATISKPYPGAILAIRIDKLPPDMVELINETGLLKGNTVFYFSNQAYYQAAGGVMFKADYAIQGFLLQSRISARSFLDLDAVFLAPTFDVFQKYEFSPIIISSRTTSTTKYDTLLIGANGIQVKLVSIEGYTPPPFMDVENPDALFLTYMLTLISICIGIIGTIYYIVSRRIQGVAV